MRQERGTGGMGGMEMPGGLPMIVPALAQYRTVIEYTVPGYGNLSS